MAIQTHKTTMADDRLCSRLIVSAGLVWCKNRLFIQQRSPHSPHGPGSMEFPGGKVELGESPIAALARELIEELGSVAHGFEIGPLADVCHHTYDEEGLEVILIFYHVNAGCLAHGPSTIEWLGRIDCEPGVKVYAIEPQDLDRDQFLAGDLGIVDLLLKGTISMPVF